MATDPKKYSLYSQRSAEEQYVNWGQVASDVTKGIVTIAAERQGRRDAIDKQTTEAIEKLSEVADVNNGSARALLITGSNMSKENLMIQTDLLKRGLITEQDYQLFLNQQQTGYSSLSTAIKQWDKYYTAAQERLGVDSLGNIIAADTEIYNNESMLAFGNLTNKMLWTNPTNGQMQLVQMSKDSRGNYTAMPDAKKEPGMFLNPNYMNNRMNFQENRKTLSVQADGIVESLAPFIEAEVYDGVITSFDDFRRYADWGKKEDGTKQTYEGWLGDEVGALVAVDSDIVQILTGKGYNIAQDEAEYRKKHCKGKSNCDLKKWIKVSYEDGSPVYDINDAKKNEAERFAKNAIEVRIGKTIKKSGKPSETQATIQETKTDIINEYNTILTGGNETNVRDLLDGQIKLRNDKEPDPNKKIVGYELTDDSIIFEYADGKKSEPILRRAERKGDNPATEEIETDFVTYEGTGLTNQIYRLYNELGGHGGGAFNSAAQVQSAVKDYNIELGTIRDGDTLAGRYRQAVYDMSDAKSQTQAANDFVKAMGGYESAVGYTDNTDIDNVVSQLDVEVEKAFPLELLNEMDKEGLTIGSTFEAKDDENDPSFIEYQIIDKTTGEVIKSFKVTNIYGSKSSDSTKKYKEIYDEVHKGFVQPYLSERNEIRTKANKKTRSGGIGSLDNL